MITYREIFHKGLVKTAAKPFTIAADATIRQLSNVFKNYSKLRRMAVNGANAKQLLPVLRGIGIGNKYADMSSFIRRLITNTQLTPVQLKRIARDASKEAKISLSDFKPHQIRNIRKPQQILGHIFNYQGKPSLMFNSDQVPSALSMQSESLWSAVNAAMQRFWGRSFRLPVNTEGVSNYITYARFPGTYTKALSKMRDAKLAGQLLDYNITNAQIGNAIRYSQHANPNGMWKYLNLIAPVRDTGGQLAVYNLPKTLRQLYDKGFIPHRLYTVIDQPSAEAASLLKQKFMDNFGQQGVSLFQKLTSGKGKLPEINLPQINIK